MNFTTNTNIENESIPWIEKFRPSEFEHIVLDPLNKEILQNIINTSYFPNLLLYGPPGKIRIFFLFFTFFRAFFY